MMKMRKYLLVCLGFLIFTGFGNASLPEIFPTVDLTSVKYLPFGDSILISNDVEYIYACKWSAQTINQCMLSTPNLDDILLYKPSLYHDIRWSYDNRQLLMKHSNRCVKSGNLYVFDTLSKVLESRCNLTLSNSASWSPLNTEELYNQNNEILNIQTGETYPFAPIKDIDLNQIQHAIGYGDFLWDAKTHIPLGRLFGLELCPLESEEQSCIAIIDTNTIAPNSLILVSESNGPWILWLALPRTEKTSVRFSDYILYLTYLPTLETREIFRLSQLGQPRSSIQAVSWSADRKTIAFHSSPSYDEIIVPEGVLPVIEAQHGTLILTLDWPDTPR